MNLSTEKSYSFRPGVLARPIQARLNESGENLSGYVRRLIAADLGLEPPTMTVGNPDIGDQSAAGIAARRKRRKPRPARRSRTRRPGVR